MAATEILKCKHASCAMCHMHTSHDTHSTRTQTYIHRDQDHNLKS